MEKNIELRITDGIMTLAIADGTALPIKAEEPLLIQTERYELFDNLLCVVSQKLRTCYLTEIYQHLYYRNVRPTYRLLQSRTTYELSESSAVCINKLKELTSREADEPLVIFTDILSALLEQYPFLPLLLRKLREKNCFIIAMESKYAISTFLEEFFKQIIRIEGETATYNGRPIRLYRNVASCDDLSGVSILLNAADEYKADLSSYELEGLIVSAITPDLGRETFRKLLERIEGNHRADDSLMDEAIKNGKPWVLEELISSDHGFTEDIECSIVRAIEALMTPPDFKEKLDILKRHYPKWFSSDVYGFLMLSTFLYGADHNDHLILVNQDEAEKRKSLSDIRKDMFDYLVSSVPFPSLLRCEEETENSLLHIAADHCFLLDSLFDAVLELGLDPNAYNDNHDTPLHLACRFIYPHAAEALLAAGANPDLENFDRNVPLHLASAQCTELLLKAGADTSRQNNEWYTPLMAAIADPGLTKKAAIPRIALLSDSYDDSLTDTLGENALMLMPLCEVYDESVFSRLISRTRDIDRRDKQGRTLLYHLASHVTESNADFIKAVLSAGASSYVRNCNGETPLFALARHNVLDKSTYIRIIREFPADILDLQDFKEQSVLHHAVEYKNSNFAVEN